MKSGYSKKKTSDTIFITFMLAVPIISFIVFYLYINFNALLMAFHDGEQFTLKYFEMFFKELAKWDMPRGLGEALRNTLAFFTLSECVMFPVSLFFSYFLYKKIYCYKYFRIVFFFPSIISGVVLTTLFRYMLNGPITDIYVNWFGVDPAPLFFNSSTYAMGSIMAYQVWLGLAGNMVLYSGTMARIPNGIKDSAKIDGVGFWRELFQIVIPMIWPTLQTLLLMSVIGIFSASGPVLLFTQGDYGTMTISYWMYDKTVVQGAGSPVAMNYAAATGMVFTILGLPIVFTVNWLLNKFDANIEY